jgi:hypothetical protein
MAKPSVWVAILTFPVAFILVSLIVTFASGTDDMPLVLDSVILTFPMALMAWLANAIVVLALRRKPTSRPAPWAVVSALAGMATVFTLYLFQFVMTPPMWGVSKLFFPAMYWAVAAASTGAAYWLLRRRGGTFVASVH